MSQLHALEELSVKDNGRTVVRVDKTDPKNIIVERGVLTNIVIGKYVTHFDFTTDSAVLTGCSNWSSKINYYDVVEFEQALLENSLHDQLHIVAQLSYRVAVHPELTQLALQLYEKLVAAEGIELVRKAAMTSVTGWYADSEERQKRFIQRL